MIAYRSKLASRYGLQNRRYKAYRGTAPTFGSYKRPIFNNAKFINFKSAFVGTEDDVGVAGHTVMTLHANSLFDPFGAHSTNQPIGFDDVSNIWAAYRVMSGMLKVVIHNDRATLPLRVNAFAARSNPAAEYNQLGQTGVSYTMIPPHESRTIYVKFDVANLLGEKSIQQNAAIAAAVTADPTTIVRIYINTWCSTITPEAASIESHIMLELSQTAKLFNHHELEDS